MVDGCHELIQYVFSKNLLDNNCDHKLCIISHEHCLNTLFQSIWSHIVHLYGLICHELFEYVFEKHLLENACGRKVYIVEKNKI